MNGMEILVKTLKDAGYEGTLGAYKDKNYKILWDLEQRTDLWKTLRENSCGGTGAYDLLRRGYVYSSTKKSTLKHATPSTKWGADHEEPAREIFASLPQIQEFFKKEHLQGLEAGMILRPDLEQKCHYSPDWLLVDQDNKNWIKGLCEIKCFQEKHHSEILSRQDADTKIICQMQFGMFMCEVDYCWFIAYAPMMEDPSQRLFVKKYEKEQKYVESFEKALKCKTN